MTPPNESPYLEISNEKYKFFAGDPKEQMPLLISEGRTPVSVHEAMLKRVEVINQSLKSYSTHRAWKYGSEQPTKRFSYHDIKSVGIISRWWNHIDTGDGLLYHPDGRIKVVLDAAPLQKLNRRSRLEAYGRVKVTEEDYDQLEGEELTRKQSLKFFEGRFNNHGFTSTGQVVNDPVWKALSRDPLLLREYAKYCEWWTKHSDTLGNLKDEIRAFHRYVPMPPEETPALGLVPFWDLMAWGTCYGVDGFLTDYCWLVGKEKSTLEEKVRV